MKEKPTTTTDATASAFEEMQNDDELAGARPAPPPAGEQAASGALAIIRQTQAHVDTITKFIVDSIEELETELTKVKSEALADCVRMQNELEGHVMAAEALVRQVGEIGKLAADIKVKRVALMSGTR